MGYNESTVVRIRSKCQCRCGPAGHCHDAGQSPCRQTQNSNNQEQRPNYGMIKDSDSNKNCRADGSGVVCSDRGVCECGKCVCEQSRLGAVYGKYCELDDFSCPYEGGLLCGSKGDTIRDAANNNINTFSCKIFISLICFPPASVSLRSGRVRVRRVCV